MSICAPRERLDRRVERARAVVRLERERRAPFAVAPVEPRVGRERGEARVRRVVADVVGDHDERVHPRGAVARDRDDGRIAELRDRGRGVARRGGDDRRRPRHRGEELAALVERDGMRADLAHVVERDRGGPDEAMADREDRLGDDRERGVVQEVVRLVHGPDERALDREHAVRAGAGGDRLDDVLERRLGDEAGGGEQPVAGRGAVGAFAAGVGDGVVVRRHVLPAFRSGRPPDQLAGAGGRAVRRLAPKGEGKGERQGAGGGRSPSRTA